MFCFPIFFCEALEHLEKSNEKHLLAKGTTYMCRAWRGLNPTLGSHEHGFVGDGIQKRSQYGLPKKRDLHS